MFGSRGVGVVRATKRVVRAVFATETVPVPVVEPMLAIEQLRRETVRANLKGKRPLRRGHEARGNERAQRQGHQQNAEHPFARIAT